MKILIVDDEQIIVAWLKKNIEGISPNYTVVQVCSNGQQALQYCQENPVDVLFTDIRMPIMDGITLMSSLKAQQKMPYTVLLTAYDDFDYARQALHLGAKEFLLKTEITEQALRKTLEEATKNITHTATAINDPLVDMLTELVTTGAVADAIGLKALWQQSGLIILLEVQKPQLLTRCSDMLSYVYAEEKLELAAIPFDKTSVAFFSAKSNNVDGFVKKCMQTMHSFGISWSYIAYAYCGQDCDLVESFKQAQEELFYYRYYQINTKTELSPSQRVTLSEIEEEISGLIKIENYKLVLQRVEEWLALTEQLCPPTFRVHSVSMRFLLQLFWDKIPEKQRKTVSVEKIVGIIQTNQFALFKILFLQRIKDLVAMLPDDEQHSYSPIVAKVILYLKTNYSQPLTLESIANTVHLNRSYLSTLFKKETDMNLFEYLQQYRLEMAKQLLLQKKLSVNQVCEQVGLPDAGYFSKLFKKYVGITPLDYRKQQSDISIPNKLQ